MRIRLSDPALIDDLLAYLESNACHAVQTSQDMLAVSLSHSLPYDAARLELDFHIADWRGRHGDATAVILD